MKEVSAESNWRVDRDDHRHLTERHAVRTAQRRADLFRRGMTGSDKWNYDQAVDNIKREERYNHDIIDMHQTLLS